MIFQAIILEGKPFMLTSLQCVQQKFGLPEVVAVVLDCICEILLHNEIVREYTCMQFTRHAAAHRCK